VGSAAHFADEGRDEAALAPHESLSCERFPTSGERLGTVIEAAFGVGSRGGASTGRAALVEHGHEEAARDEATSGS
jgi:hypothetical protein